MLWRCRYCRLFLMSCFRLDEVLSVGGQEHTCWYLCGQRPCQKTYVYIVGWDKLSLFVQGKNRCVDTFWGKEMPSVSLPWCPWMEWTPTVCWGPAQVCWYLWECRCSGSGHKLPPEGAGYLRIKKEKKIKAGGWHATGGNEWPSPSKMVISYGTRGREFDTC